MTLLKLSDQDQLLAIKAAQVLIERRIGESAIPELKRVKKWRSPEERRRVMVLSCGAEIGVARLLSLPWAGVDSFKDMADVGDNIEVRWTASDYLILRPTDREGDVCFLVTGGTLNDLRLLGYYPVTKGRVDKYKLENEEVWFIPKADLYTYMPIKRAAGAFIGYLGAHLV